MGLLEGLVRDSEGVRRGSDRGLRRGKRKKEGFGVEKAFLAWPKELVGGV